MKIADNAMKFIGVFLAAGLAGCDAPDAAPNLASDAAPGPVLDTTTPSPFCSLDEPTTCQDWWPRTTLTDVTPQGISYNKLGADALMFNALLRNPRANRLIAEYPGGLSGLLGGDDPDAKYFQSQLQDPFARRTMDYLVGCALPAEPPITWTDPISGNLVEWEGDLGLCPRWKSGPMDQACRELVSACLLARNNAHNREVIISVRGGSDDDRVALPLEEPVQGGQPCESGVQSFESDCLLAGPDSNCKGWRSEYVGTCDPDQLVALTVEVGGHTRPLIRICHGVSGCDYVDPNVSVDPSIPVDPGVPVAHVASRRILCDSDGPCTDYFTFTCTKKKAFTLMAADGGFHAQVTGGTYPAREKDVFPWQEGAFYGDLFCGPRDDCSPGTSGSGNGPVDFSLWVEVCGDLDEECDNSGIDDYCDALGTGCVGRPSGTVVYHWSGINVVYEPSLGSERDLLMRRASQHTAFVGRYNYNGIAVYRMYSCMSPNWAQGTAMARERLCAGPGNAFYCAAHNTGRCWSADDTQCQCLVKDVIGPHTGFPPDDRDYGDCSDDRDRTWSHPLTVFLNDPCDLVPATELPDHGECTMVPLCVQTKQSPL